MLITILIAAVAALALFLIFAVRRPDTFRVERSTWIRAAPETIFALINNLRSFNTWNPYEKKEPGLKGSYSGAASGPGAAYAWKGKKVGVGRLEIVDSAPASKVAMKLDFIAPFKAHNIAEFTLQPLADATQVTWAMHGPVPFISKLMQMFLNMDRMIGKDFEDGLSNLKALAEGRSPDSKSSARSVVSEGQT